MNSHSSATPLSTSMQKSRAQAWIGLLSRSTKWFALALGLLVLGLGTGAGLLKDRLKVGGFSIPGTQFHTASSILGRDFGMASEKTLVAVFESTAASSDPGTHRLKVPEPKYAKAVDVSLKALAALPQVERIESFYNTGIPDLVSPDNTITYALVHLKGTEEELEKLTPVFRKQAALSPEAHGVAVYLTGQPVANFDIEQISNQDIAKVDLVTFPLILLLLVVLLGTFFSGVLPLLSGIVSVVLSLGGIYILSLFTDVSLFAMNIASMIGLGLSIDFSLILICRFQEEWKSVELGAEQDNSAVGSDLKARTKLALTQAFGHSARSVFFSGFTLFTTVSVLTLLPIMILRSIAQAIVISTACGLLVFFTLLPLLILKWGDKLIVKSGNAAWLLARPFVFLRRDPSLLQPGEVSRWLRLTSLSIKQPVVALIGCTLILLAMVLPTHSMRKIGTTLEVLPPSVESRRAVEILQAGFGRGTAAPLLLVMDTDQRDGIWKREALKLVYQVHEELRADPRVEKVQSLMSLIPNPSESWAQSLSKDGIQSVSDLRRIAERFVRLDRPTQSTFFFAFSKQAETHPDTLALLTDLRARIPQWQKNVPGLRITIGGTPAQHADFDSAVYQAAPPLVAASLLITFFVLMVFFRSIVLPLKAVLLNLLSLAASFGVLTLVFQHGHGARLLGFESLGGVQVYTPILLFSILFGLSTDYEVFVLSRVKEFIHQGKSTPQAAFLGIQRSSRVIGAAASVMVLVFFSFAFSSVVTVKEIGFSLAVAVLIDATLVRMKLVAARLVPMQKLNWWMPSLLRKWIPEVEA